MVICLNYFVSKNSTKLHEHLFLYHEITAPNIQIDSQVLRDHSTFGGNIVTNRSKNINGYLVPWSTLTSSYNWFNYEIDFNELIPRYHSSKNAAYEYDKQTKNKVATFYHPLIKQYYDGVQNELEEVSQMENYVAEVAISFDKPYTFAEIKRQIPDNLNIGVVIRSQIEEQRSQKFPGMPELMSLQRSFFLHNRRLFQGNIAILCLNGEQSTAIIYFANKVLFIDSATDSQLKF